MNKVHVLDTHLTNMIAAGEVVERPAGIIKELVENAIDAQASTIDVSIREGGMAQIIVEDNGEGMSALDLSNAFERHSTSKIVDTADLNAIRTFGFRGEALPSIASVSLVEATTNHQGESYRITIDNGLKSPVERAARNQGTTLNVRNLFLKTPARLKYIKNIHYENSIVQDIMQKFAMGNPHIAFSLTTDDKLSFRTYGRNDIKDVFHRIYGGTISADAQEFSATNYDFEISGVMALPQHSRANRYAIWLYINDRMIRYPKAQKAIAESFRRHMPVDRYPIVVMNIKVDPQLVDVNVHPSKWEIRLSKESQLLELIHTSLEAQLQQGMKPQRVSVKPVEVQQDFSERLFPQGEFVGKTESVEVQEPRFDFVPSESVREAVPAFEALPPFEQSHEEPLELNPVIESEPQREPGLEQLTALAQMSGKYILAQGESGLFIVDQHAAMERVRYEYYQKQLLGKAVATQDLLVPIMIEGYGPLLARLERVNEILEPFQIELESFGEDTLVLRSIPIWIKDDEIHDFLHTALGMIQEDRSIREEDLRRRAIATLACHSSVRFNEYLSHEAMQELLDSLRACDQPFHCPHGRPTLITIDHQQLIKEFKR